MVAMVTMQAFGWLLERRLARWACFGFGHCLLCPATLHLGAGRCEGPPGMVAALVTLSFEAF